MISTYFELIRIKQWIKNFVIFLPLFFAGNKIEFSIYINLIQAFIAFSFITSAVYILNDIIDRKDDINHLIKKYRPIASNKIKVKVAGFNGVLLGFFGVLYLLLFEYSALVPVLLYATLMIFYCFLFRKIAILDVIVISIGFVLRLFIGGQVAGTPISIWIIIMVFLLALFISFSKRRDDLINNNNNGRESLKHYNLSFVDTVICILVPVIIVTYILYCTSDSNILRLGEYLYLTTLFVISGFLRYLQLVFVKNGGGDPVQLFYNDAALKVIVLSWIITFGGLLYF